MAVYDEVAASDIPISDVCTTAVTSVAPTARVTDCLALMLGGGFRHVSVQWDAETSSHCPPLLFLHALAADYRVTLTAAPPAPPFDPILLVHFAQLPVTENKVPIGVISMRDITQFFLQDA